ncbi:tetratricopeptide repeat protein [Algicola sagamiensis]|uniref:hypothetical protein n=1 Tax=Algicola sagamiensis TaxID=163869 RepID=UPI000369C477|nr:hypothetical protein [Algicola sagamiensis]
MSHLPRLHLVIVVLCYKLAFAVYCARADADSHFLSLFQQIEQEMNTHGKSQALNQAFDMKAHLDRGFSGISVSPGFYDSLTKRINKETPSVYIFGMPSNKKIRFFHMKPSPQGAEGYFRVSFQETGVNYFRLIAKSTSTKKVQIIDFYNYLSGQFQTESIRILSLILSQSNNYEVIANDSIQKDLTIIAQFIRNHDIPGLKKYYPSLSRSYKKNWTAMSTLMRFNLDYHDPLYQMILNDIAIQFGADPRAGLILMDYYYLQRDYKPVLQILDVLSREFAHKDAGVYMLKATTYYLMDNIENALKNILIYINMEPDDESAYQMQLSFLQELKKYDEMVRVTKFIMKRFNLTLKEFQTSSNLEGFMRSAEFQKFKQQINKTLSKSQ